MNKFILGYLIIGILLVLQHSCRFYLKNRLALGMKKYSDVFKDGKIFYFTLFALWPFALDFLFEVRDFNDLKKEIGDE